MSSATMGLGHMPRTGRTHETPRRSRRRPVRHEAQGGWLGPAIWAAFLALFVVAIGMMSSGGDSVPSRASSAIQVTVAPAETLWSIASAHRLPGASTAETVDAIVAANGLEGRTLTAGASLRVPTVGVTDAAVARSAETVAAR